jgi:hypothetical protein
LQDDEGGADAQEEEPQDEFPTGEEQAQVNREEDPPA